MRALVCVCERWVAAPMFLFPPSSSAVGARGRGEGGQASVCLCLFVLVTKGARRLISTAKTEGKLHRNTCNISVILSRN